MLPRCGVHQGELDRAFMTQTALRSGVLMVMASRRQHRARSVAIVARRAISVSDLPRVCSFTWNQSLLSVGVQENGKAGPPPSFEQAM